MFFFAALAAGVTGLAGWLTHTRVTELDIRSGLVRTRTVVYGLSIGEEREATWISNSIGATASDHDWRMCGLQGPMVLARINFHWQSIRVDLWRFEQFAGITPMTPEARRAVAQHIVDLWVRDEVPESSEKFLDAAHDVLSDWHTRRPPVQPLTPADFGLDEIAP